MKTIIDVMNPMNMAWILLKDRGDPLHRLAEWMSNPSHNPAPGESQEEASGRVETKILSMLQGIADGHDLTPHDVDRILGSHILTEEGSEIEDPEIGEAEIASVKDMMHDLLDVHETGITSARNSGPMSSVRRRNAMREQSDEAFPPPRASSYARAAALAAALDDDDYDSTDASERGDDAWADDRTMTERGMRRFENREGRPVPGPSIRGLTAPLTAASQGEGRVGPDVMDENQLIRYEAPQLREMIRRIGEELTRRGHGETYQGLGPAETPEYPPPVAVSAFGVREGDDDSLPDTATWTDEEDPVSRSSPNDLGTTAREWPEEIIEEVSEEAVPRGRVRIMATPNDIRASLASHGIDPSVIRPEHIEQYQQFMRVHNRHPTLEEIDMHLG